MKCPKCSYLGFETGDRCKNCGYDFSLMAAAPAADPASDLPLRSREVEAIVPDATLPLFSPREADDVPLVSLPLAPRPPLAVRRTPERPRLRAIDRVARMPEPALNFREEPVTDDDVHPAERLHVSSMSARAVALEATANVGVRRVLAALIDHAVLLAIDAAVVYFTLRMAGLAMADVRALPPAPMAIFLGLLKFSYFTAFTAVGGQTIGKMALHIRVVAEDGAVDAPRAVRRTLAGVVSLVPLGLGFLPAFFGDRRALHDRLTETRVVGLPSA
jgi:uncharacterized RDD family membrane protein YckC